MSKITLNPLSNVQTDSTGVTQINANFATTQTAFDNTLSLDGTSPNQMGADLDMNSNRILNLPAPSSDTEPLRLQDLAGTSSAPPTAQISLSGDVSGLSSNNTVNKIQGTAVSGVTGSGTVVLQTSPSLVTPNVGVATATTINKLTLTAPSSSATITIANGKTLTVNNTLTFAGNADGTTQTFPASSAMVITNASIPSGDLSGTYPSPTVSKVNAVAYPSAPAVNTIPAVTASSSVAYQLVANSSLAAATSSWSFHGNPSTTLTNPVYFTIDSLTNKASPSSVDELMIFDTTSSSLKKTTVSAVAAGGTVASINGATGAITVQLVPGGRLTLSSATPIMTTSLNTRTSIFYTPYIHSFIHIYDGTNFTLNNFTELSQTTQDGTKSPAATVNNSNYDMFVWNDAGTLRCTRGAVWTNNTTRGAAAAITSVGGIFLNASSISNGPNAQRGTYVGTIHTTTASSVSFNVTPAAAASGANPALGVWNAYNRVPVYVNSQDNTAFWTYNTTSWRPANGATSNAIRYLDGLGHSYLNANYNVAVSGSQALVGINLNNTSAIPAMTAISPYLPNDPTGGGQVFVQQTFPPALGFNTVTAMELATTATTSFFYGAGWGNTSQTQTLNLNLMM